MVVLVLLVTGPELHKWDLHETPKKAIREEKPDLKTFKVKKTGEGLKTEYTIIPIE